MPRVYVVLDSNVYRALSDESMSALVAAERSHSIQAVASRHVCYELLSHVASFEDRDCLPALAAIRRLTKHCAFYDGRKNIVQFPVSTEQQLLLSLFGERVRDDSADAFGRFLGRVLEANDIRADSDLVATLKKLANTVNQAEEYFVQALWDRLVLSFDPNAKSWDVFRADPAKQASLAGAIESEAGLEMCARMFAESVAKQFSIPLDEARLRDAVTRVTSQFETALRLYNHVIAHVIRNGSDLRKKSRANWYWDLHLSFLISDYARFEKSPVWLVTSDGVFSTVARKTGAHALVHTLDEYKEILALDGDEFFDLANGIV